MLGLQNVHTGFVVVLRSDQLAYMAAGVEIVTGSAFPMRRNVRDGQGVTGDVTSDEPWTLPVQSLGGQCGHLGDSR